MKQKLKRFMAGFMAMLTLVGTLFTNGSGLSSKVCKFFFTPLSVA